jgi:hypothetical protein
LRELKNADWAKSKPGSMMAERFNDATIYGQMFNELRQTYEWETDTGDSTDKPGTSKVCIVNMHLFNIKLQKKPNKSTQEHAMSLPEIHEALLGSHTKMQRLVSLVQLHFESE